MSGIICAIRGGSDSKSTVATAIDLARTTGLTLHFLYVVNLDFLERTSSSRVQTISTEMEQMGDFILMSAQATRHGVTHVECLIREGDIRKQLRRIARETHANVMVMGRPVRSPGSNVFKPGEFAAFVAELEHIGDLRVVQVTPS
ncbi:MAG: universal stress protein [Ardenticatenaceae bacterium]|nr:universal stress protein [Ardenticatenaceae bacterium]